MLTLTFLPIFGCLCCPKTVLRQSKDLFRGSYQIKEITFDPHIAYQSFKLTSELHFCEICKKPQAKFFIPPFR